MGILSKIFTGGASSIVKTISEEADKWIDTKAEKSERDIKLQEIVNSHLEKLNDQAQSELDTYMGDMQDARAANTAIQESDKASWLSKNVAFIIDLTLLAVWSTFTLYLGGRAINLINQASVDLTAVLSLYATVTAVFMMSVQFHRGASKGGEKANDYIRKMNDSTNR